ncbi:S8 family peptidase [Botryobacter ruber]|uniref:S8 family peptidase n=1 Tax=Botryobacter ruber TaxID=2171629 RepID=UPI0013E321D5|nr:S8 family peptidase [Botryobacter ruber]
MKKKYNRFLSTTAAAFVVSGMLNIAAAQPDAVSSVASFDESLLNWYNKDASQDKIHGVGVNRAYNELLQNRKPKKTVVVAVIDSGIDIKHTELQGKIWTNPNEIPGNGIDDDNNGYVDDIHGWGFLGNSNGENVQYETYEYVRILRELTPKYRSIKSIKEVPAHEQAEYKTYLQCRDAFVKEYTEQQKTKANLENFEQYLNRCEAILAHHLGKEEVTLEDIKGITSRDPQVLSARKWLLGRYDMGFTKEDLQKAKKMNNLYLEEHLNLKRNHRTILADNPQDLNDRNYGNNDVTGPRADHGTPVAGIIGGVRNNNVGIDGIAEDIRIMALRAVPNGDEYDKDIALAIRYAVDNGANIINMSFGKAFSPQKKFVDEAVKYAEEKNVLLVHAAGNDAKNVDQEAFYPNRKLSDGTSVKNWLEVGAVSRLADKTFCAVFSNYGKESVDLFAPGVDIVALSPDNQYGQMDGTSFAGPVVSGVAALVWSHYPELTAVELKEILLHSCTTYPRLKVYYPNSEDTKSKKKTKFSNLSRTGGVVNAYEALKLAEKKARES